MAHEYTVRAMPPNPQHFACHACEYLPHLALRLQCGTPGSTDDRRALGKLAKFGVQHGCRVSFGTAVEQLAMTSESNSKQLILESVEKWTVDSN
eukprot:1701043-Amphidinium_carterae.1